MLIVNTDERPLLARGHRHRDGRHDSGSDIDIPVVVVPQSAAAPLSGVVAPTGNAFATHSAISVQGATALDSGREYLANFGLLPSHGSVAPSTPYRDKVAL